MATSLTSTGITFPDATTQTTAAGAVNTSTVLAANAGASSGAVGSFGTGGTSATPGSNYAGSSIGLGTGTWKCMNTTSLQVYNICGSAAAYYCNMSCFVRVS